jgi:WD40 repeat protein
MSCILPGQQDTGIWRRRRILASGGGDNRGGEVKLWNVTTGQEIAALAGYSNTLYSLVFSPDGKMLASGGERGLRVLDVSARKELTFFKGLRPPAWVVAFSLDSKELAAFSGFGELKVWDVASGKELVFLQHHIPAHSPRELAFSKDLNTLAVSNYQEIDLWDVATGRQHATLSEHRGQVEFLANSLDGKVLMAMSCRGYPKPPRLEGDLKLWDVATGKEHAGCDGPFGEVLVAALSPDCKTVGLLQIAADKSPDLKLLDVATGKQRILRTVPAHSFTSLAFTGDGRLFVIGTPDDKALKLWEVSLPKGKER